MKANVGDRVVLESTHAGGHRRIGVIIELRREDGRPPYLVRWPECHAAPNVTNFGDLERP